MDRMLPVNLITATELAAQVGGAERTNRELPAPVDGANRLNKPHGPLSRTVAETDKPPGLRNEP